jgi:hypothetical protein
VDVGNGVLKADQHSAGTLKKVRNWYARTRANKVERRIESPLRFFVKAGQRSDSIKEGQLIRGIHDTTHVNRVLQRDRERYSSYLKCPVPLMKERGRSDFFRKDALREKA